MNRTGSILPIIDDANQAGGIGFTILFQTPNPTGESVIAKSVKERIATVHMLVTSAIGIKRYYTGKRAASFPTRQVMPQRQLDYGARLDGPAHSYRAF